MPGGWRLAFGIGGMLGFGVLVLRLAVPESPRWLMLRGREEEARAVVDAIEREVRKHTPDLARLEEKPLRLRTRDNTRRGARSSSTCSARAAADPS
jgi:MFS family permease